MRIRDANFLQEKKMDIDLNIDKYIWTPEGIESAEMDVQSMCKFLSIELRRCQDILERVEGMFEDEYGVIGPDMQNTYLTKYRKDLEEQISKFKEYEKYLEISLNGFRALREKAEESAAKIVLVNGAGHAPRGVAGEQS
jgi:hypothetical protein